MSNPLLITFGSTSSLRLERGMLLARYDCGALTPVIFTIIKQIETEISWREHIQHQPEEAR